MVRIYVPRSARLLPTQPWYEVAVGFLSALALPLILDVNYIMCVFVFLYTPKEREENNAVLRFACQRRVRAGAILNTSGRGQYSLP